ncbi:acetoin dehydrogenase dihydrolipoyllysine-residue acetyltransferase subunit [Phenylobacterium montanum]|uniref:Acetoin dehydrogenase dihydrolipoyllysine-residue acetyltransferase subunit n=1 Tax=Phenylobacterium montanum TaxID=2823693 RepID=A0A975G4A2_9CAUL|nr:acetoin dehydrogenase dihydrolipoyllysine-residue acetyltransferase subunit [Caulobacter sp. S6]QUD90529.1 acetoin dehydrogenase dihydrolipoyllysine-residue acetyltransferase subunit [Caulobacter sp. S6]
MPSFTPIRMPKWGLSMQEGTIVDWWRAEGAEVAEGDDLVDIETAKINNVCECPASGVLRRIVAQPGETLPVGALIGVLADASAPDAEIDAFIAEFQANFVPEAEDGEAAQALALSTVEAGGRTLRIGRAGQGEGPPIVLLHGFSGDLNGWLFNIEALGALGPVIAIDLPGHGGSSRDVGDGSLAVLADAVGAALDALGVGAAHLVGHSLGAAVAARLAIDRPGLAASISLIAPAGLSANAVSEEFLSGVVDAQRARDLKPFLEMLVADPGLVTKAMVEDVLKFKRLDGVEEALGLVRDRLVEGSDLAALRADLGKLRPALVVSSRADRIVGPADEALLPPGSRVVWIDSAGHLPHLEAADQVNRLLAETISTA